MLRNISFMFLFGLFFVSCTSHKTSELRLEVYNPDVEGVFPVSSVLIEGNQDAILIDAQFSKVDAEKLIEKIKNSKKNLKLIYISHSDPDYYFGLEFINKAFPDVKIVALPSTVEAIKASRESKLKYWSPVLKSNAPTSTIVPEVLNGDTIDLEGNTLDIIQEKDTVDSVVWIPSIQAIVGGVPIFGNTHLWLADSQTIKERKAWAALLQKIIDLQPKVVIPGHFYKGTFLDVRSVEFSKNYLVDFEKAMEQTKNSQELITIMKAKYPDLQGLDSLEMSAKVLKKEMKWPQ